MAAEVDEQSKFVARCLEVINGLRAMFFRQDLYRFEFQYDFPVTNKVGSVCLFQCLAFVSKGNLWLRRGGYFSSLEFDGEAFLINGFEKPGAEFVIDLEARAYDGVAFLFIGNNLHTQVSLF